MVLVFDPIEFINKSVQPTGTPDLSAEFLNDFQASHVATQEALNTLETSSADFSNEARNSIMTGGGSVSYGVVANKLKWTTRFILIPVKGSNSPGRYIDVLMPTTGVTDAAGAERASVDGITLNSYDSLWFVHTRGGGATTGNSFKVINFADTTLIDTYFANENAYLIATYDPSSVAVYLRNGLVVKAGSTLQTGKPIPLLTDADIAASNKDGVAGTASLRTLGTGAQQATPGNHQIATDPHSQYYDFTNEARNTILSGGGDISWAAIGRKFKWSFRFLLLPVAEDNSSARFIEVLMPTSGVTDVVGAERANVDGITLNSYDSLWFVHARGGGATTGNSFKVINFADSALISSYFNDENAYIIAVNNPEPGSNDSLYLCNGIIIPFGKTISAGKAIPLLTDADIATANKDGTAGTASMRTLGTGAQQAAAGDHAHDANKITSGILVPARLGSGTPDGTKALFGDGAWKVPTAGDILSSLVNAEVSITGATTLTATAFGKMHVLTGASSYTVGLPAASGNAGKMIGFRVPSSVAVTVGFTLDPNAAETIDSATTRVLNTEEAVILQCDGTNWHRIARKNVTLTLLNIAYNTDVYNATAVAGSTWFDFVPNQSFTVFDAASIIEVRVLGNAYSSTTTVYQTAAFLDSAGANTKKNLSGGGAGLINLSGSFFTAFAPGAHTIRVMGIANGAGTVYFLPNTQPNIYACSIQILEKKQ